MVELPERCCFALSPFCCGIMYLIIIKAEGRSFVQVLPLFCFDPRQFIMTPYGNKKTGDYRAQFLLETALDLKQRLRSIGSDLLLYPGKPEDAFRGIECMSVGATARAPQLHSFVKVVVVRCCYSEATCTDFFCFLMWAEGILSGERRAAGEHSITSVRSDELCKETAVYIRTPCV